MKTAPLAETAIVPPVRLKFPFTKKMQNKFVAQILPCLRVLLTLGPAILCADMWSK